jgi:para-nitrobenzyl esterase
MRSGDGLFFVQSGKTPYQASLVAIGLGAILPWMLTSVGCGTSSHHGDADVDLPQDGGTSGDANGVGRPQVRTTGGMVIGAEENDVAIFRAIPYAAPPLEERRFARPQPHPGWQQPLDTTRTEADIVCPQRNTAGTVIGKEDCLILNVYAPLNVGNAPVMVFIHGGAFIQGASTLPIYDGRALAKRGVVVVSLNYRVGVLGFLATSALQQTDGAAGNFGLWDQRLALQWVRDNAAAFGGDPANVTMFGQSAGAASVAIHLVSPGSQSLFDRAIVQSGGGGSNALTQAQAYARYQPAVAALGCAGADDVVACLRADSLTVTQLVGAMDAVASSGLGLPAFNPHVDGVMLPSLVATRFSSGNIAAPLIVGSNADEATLFTANTPVNSSAAFRGILLGITDAATADALLLLYSAEAFGSWKSAYNAFFGEVSFVCPSLEMAKAAAPHVKVHAYHFTRRLGSGAAGSFHGLELGYLFDSLSALVPGYVPNATDQTLSTVMQQAWVGYAKDEVPVFAPGWDEFTIAAANLAVFDQTLSKTTQIKNGRCDLLRTYGLL